MNITTLLIVASLAIANVARADDETAPAAPKPLDLRPPDITKLYTQRQLDQLIARMEAKNIEEVEVEGARVPAPTFTPRVWPAIAAPFWALFHPDASLAHPRAPPTGPGTRDRQPDVRHQRLPRAHRCSARRPVQAVTGRPASTICENAHCRQAMAFPE